MSDTLCFYIAYVLGYFATLLLGRFLTKRLVRYCWSPGKERFTEDVKKRFDHFERIPEIMGYIELSIYYVSLILRPEFVAIWLTLKVAHRVVTKEGRNGANGSQDIREIAQTAFNIFLIGAGMNILIAVVVVGFLKFVIGLDFPGFGGGTS